MESEVQVISSSTKPLEETLRSLSKGSSRVGALVIGGDYQGLGIVRSLGRKGIPVYVVDDERSIARYSRYTSRNLKVADLSDDDTTVAALLDVAKKQDVNGWVLFATRDETVAAIARNKDLLSEYYRVPVPQFDVIRWAWDKRNTYQLARDLGIPVAHGWQARSVDELDDLDIEFPVAIKPAIKENFLRATKAKAWRANNLQELKELFSKAAEIIDTSEILIQDIIPGDGMTQYAYCTFFKNQQPVGSMTTRRVRQHPPEFGRASTYVETVDAPEVVVMSERFLSAIDYYGLAEVEYKFDQRDGKYKLLDFNARTWGYHTLGQRAGVDYPSMLFADQLGMDVEACAAEVGISWMRWVTDLPAVVDSIWNRQLKLSTYFASLKRCNTEAVFSFKDPLPSLIELALIPYLAVKRGY